MSATSTAAASALTATTVAACFIPAAWPLVAEMYKNQCDPEAIYNAGIKWLDIFDQFDQAGQTIDRTKKTLSSDDWQGEDRERFEHKIDDYKDQMGYSSILAFVVGSSVAMVGGLLFLLVVCMCVIAIIMIACMAYVIAGMAGVFTYPAVMAAVTSVTIECLEVLNVISGLCSSVAAACAAAIMAAMAVDVGGQYLFTDNKGVLGDLKQGTIDGLDNIAWGTLSRFERIVTSSGIVAGGPSVGPFLAGKGVTDGWSGGNFTDKIHKLVGDYNDGKLRH